MDNFITLIIHHGGRFERDENRKLMYVGGEVDVWENINSYLLNLFDIEDKVKQSRGYQNIVGLHYLKPYKGVKLDMNICLRSLSTYNHCIDMLNAAMNNDHRVDIFFEHSMIEELEFLPSKQQQEGQQDLVIVEPSVIQAGTIEAIGTEADDIVHHKGFQPMKYRKRGSVILGDELGGFKSPAKRGLVPPQMRGPISTQMRGSMDFIPISFPGCETGSGSGSHEPKLWHFLSSPPEFPPTKIPPQPEFSSGFKSPPERESSSPQMRGSMGLIPTPFPDCETESESREQEFWHFLPPPPGFKPKKIPPPPGFTGKEYN